jgi:hypothetical protein
MPIAYHPSNRPRTRGQRISRFAGLTTGMGTIDCRVRWVAGLSLRELRDRILCLGGAIEREEAGLG